MTHKRKNNDNVPNLRFPGFEDEWELKKLENLLSFKNGINASKEDYGTGYKFINVLDIIDNDFITYDVIKGRVNVSLETFEKSLVQYGDILFQRSSETREEVGQSNVYLDNEKNATFGGFVIRGKKIGKYEPVFFHLLLKTSTARKEITTKSGGSTRYNIGQDILTSIKLLFPTLPEQNKIACFLSKITERIQTQNEIIGKYESLMISLQERIFNQKLRFKDKNGEYYPKWNKSKLGFFLSIPSKESPKKIDVSKILTVKLNLKGVFLNERTDGLKIGATKYIVRRKGQFIYGKQNLFNGAFGIVPNEFDGFLSSGDVPSLDVNLKLINPIFLYYYLGRETYYKKLESIASGSGSKRIHETTLLSHKISIPILEEQNQIALFLSQIENKIKIEKKALKSLINQKKYFLQQLFI